MKSFIVRVLFAVLVSQPALAQEKKLNWVRETDNAGWQARDSPGEFVYKGHLWILGGWFDSYKPNPRDVWKSADGKKWEQVISEAPWIHSDLPMSIVFRDKMWMMGGWYNGRLEGHEAGNQVWSSTDGAHWKQEKKAAAWSPRVASAIVEFKGKLWLMGGIGNYFFSEGKETLLNDVWYSEDGANWELATSNAGWSPRAFHQAAVLNNKIYLFGGGNYKPEYEGYNDVWSSSDGVNWELVSESAPWHHRIWHSAVVYRDHIWMMGGWSDSPYKNWDDVWYTKDGKQWKQLKSDVRWKERHELSAYVFNDKIWITGGLIPPLANDVWSLYIPEDFFKDNKK